jgi:PAS domain S-box-containing protein
MSAPPWLPEPGAQARASVRACLLRCCRRSIEARVRTLESLTAPAFRGFFENLGVGGVQISSDGRFLQVNERFIRLTGYPREQLLEMRVGDLDHPEDRPADQERWGLFLADPDVGYDVEKRYVRQDGGVIWVHVTAARIPTGGDELTFAKTVEDITDRVVAIQALREREQRLREALAVKEEFLGMVSHELRTPLTVILGLANVVARNGSSHAQVQRTVLEIRESAEHLASLLESMLVLARVGQEAPELEPILLDRVARRAIERHREVFRKRKVRLKLLGGTPLVDGHEPWIAQVVANMLSNAEKYSPPTGRISVFIDREDGDVSVRVLDEGRGIADEDAPHIFEPFYRAAHAVKESGGLGLGLAVCKRLIDLQGGEVWALTRDSGGAEFGFSLPALDAED